jgi:hypothetical protein
MLTLWRKIWWLSVVVLVGFLGGAEEGRERRWRKGGALGVLSCFDLLGKTSSRGEKEWRRGLPPCRLLHVLG